MFPPPVAIRFFDMATSKEESKLYNAIKAIYRGTIIQSYRPDFLKNEKTGNNYEIDIYLPELKIGFEYQGGVHFKDIDRFQNDSDCSRENDMIKEDKTTKRHSDPIVIIEVFFTDLKGDILQNICTRIINTQEYYFKKLFFAKCVRLQRAFIIFEGRLSLQQFLDLPKAKSRLSWDFRSTPKISVCYLEKCHDFLMARSFGERKDIAKILFTLIPDDSTKNYQSKIFYPLYLFECIGINDCRLIDIVYPKDMKNG